ncbi:aldehyde dehydrogenase [Paenalcaligenes hominis]|uniref:aldehyde dehydrogenase n=1 Tax=Paenalcaligenes hominis TaxID=643674 RepID=UPI0035233DA3
MKKIFLAGEWVLGQGKPTVSYFPADGTKNDEFSTASVEQVDEAVHKAHQAWQQPEWRFSLPSQRARVLWKVADLIEARVEELAALQTRDNGKPLSETRGLVMSAAQTARYMASVLDTLDEELTNQRASDTLTLSVYEPLGVVAAITPWNSPIASEMQKIAPALAGGNAIVLKPAELTSLVALRLAELFEEAGLPKGLLSILPGKGSVVGNALVQHDLVRKISFTGGTNTGKQLAHVAAERLISTSLELGGKSPTVVLEDADLELAVNGVIYGIFSSAGQACIAGSRLFVHQSRYDEFVARLVEKTSRLRVGHPEDPATQVGPLIDENHLRSVDAYVQQAKAEGGQVVTGGHRVTGNGLDQGSYYAPTVITGLSNSATVCQEEIFGPVLVVMPFESEQELVSVANQSVYGLAAGIWTENYRKAWQLARLLDAGTVWINTYKKFSISTPFGGFKQSGVGREKGRHSILSYMQQKSIYIGLDSTPNPWCEG